MDSFRPCEFGKGRGLRPGGLGRGDSKKLATPSEPGGRPLARRSHGLGDRSQVSLDPNPSAIHLTELEDDGRMGSRAVKRRSNGKVGNTANFEPIQPNSSLDAVGPAGKDEGTLRLNTVQEGVDGKPYLRSLRGSVDGSDYVPPFVEGNPIQPVPDLAYAVNGDGAPVGAGRGGGASTAIDVTLLLQSMTLNKLAVMLPIVMFGTLLLVLIIFGMAFCCLRQAEETYHINIRTIESKGYRNRYSRRRRKNSASTGAAEEGNITVLHRASADQPGVGSTKKGWFLQRWYNSLKGDAAPRTVSFSTAEVISHRNPRSNLGMAKGLDGGQDTRDPSYVLDAVSDRLQQTQGRLRPLSTIWSDGGLGSSSTPGVVLATGRERSEGASPNATMVGRRMHGAKGDASTNLRHEFMSTTETTELSGDPSSNLTLTCSPGKLEHWL